MTNDKSSGANHVPAMGITGASLSDLLSKAHESAGLSLRDAAEQIGCSKGRLSGILNGDADGIGFRLAVAMADLYRIDLDVMAGCIGIRKNKGE